MQYAGANFVDVRQTNRAAVRRLLNDQGPLPRRDIAAELGLTPASVTQITGELLAEGQLVERGTLDERGRAGRKTILLDINARWKLVLTLRIEADGTHLALVDLRGKPREVVALRPAHDVEVEAALAEILTEARALLRRHGVSSGALLGLGVSVPGPVDRARGIALHAYRVWEEPVALKGFLEKGLGCPVVIENNVCAFAVGELVYGSAGRFQNSLFFKWGPGVGAAMVVDGRLYRGDRGQTCEIGHTNVVRAGKLCRCGRRGCLETVASTHALVETARRVFSREKTPQLYAFAKGDAENVTLDNVAEWISLGDAALLRAVDSVIYLVSRSMFNTMTILQPDKVYVYGYHLAIDSVWERFLQNLKDFEPTYNEDLVERSPLMGRLAYIGPAAVAVEELFLNGGAL